MKHLALLLLLTLAPGFAQDYALTIAGQASAERAITAGGQIYVPLSALEAAGVIVTLEGNTLGLRFPGMQITGGSDQLPALEGCIGTDFFNGVWRFKVHSVEPLMDDRPGWTLDVEVRNGYTETLQPVFTGLDASAERMQLVLPDNTPLEMAVTDVLAGQQLSYANLPPGGVWRGPLTFHHPFGTPPAEAERPVKLLVQVNPDGVVWGAQGVQGVTYATPHPSFRVDLTCEE
jgi:hypothetical protein